MLKFDDDTKLIPPQYTKIIALNTMACSLTNFGTFKTLYDPGDQLAWLEAELQDLEDYQGQAIMIGHQPTAHGCHTSWALRYRALMERYQHIVRFSLFGYTHRSEFSVTQPFYNDDVNIGINFVTGSLTTYQGQNPQFSVIEIDAQFLVPLKVQIYSMNMTNANLVNNPKWEVIVDYTRDYALADLRPDNLFKLAQTFRTD